MLPWSTTALGKIFLFVCFFQIQIIKGELAPFMAHTSCALLNNFWENEWKYIREKIGIDKRMKRENGSF